MIVQVPASASNLGPGFDSLGIAWKLHDRIAFEPADRLMISGCEERFRGPDNLACAGFAAAFQEKDLAVPGVSIEFLECAVPVSRGLGSSAALIAAGAAAANAMGGLGLSRGELLTVCTRVEGHPDNLAPAIFGGFTAAAHEDGRCFCARYSLSPALRFLAVIPDRELSTAAARRVLPENYSRADAVFNLSLTALLIAALGSGDMEMLRFAMRDRIHQPYRLPLIAGGEEVFALTETIAGKSAAACISGAGSTMLVVSDDEERLSALHRAFADRFPGWKLVPLEPDPDGLRIL